MKWTTLKITRALPADTKPFSLYFLFGSRESDMLDRIVGVLISWIDGRDIEAALYRGEEVLVEVPDRAWFHLTS